MPIEINFDGRWYMGQLIEVNEAGGKITGVRASWQATRGALRVIGDPTSALAIDMHSSDPKNGELVVRFADAAAANRMVSELRRRSGRSAA